MKHFADELAVSIHTVSPHPGTALVSDRKPGNVHIGTARGQGVETGGRRRCCRLHWLIHCVGLSTYYDGGAARCGRGICGGGIVNCASPIATSCSACNAEPSPIRDCAP